MSRMATFARKGATLLLAPENGAFISRYRTPMILEESSVELTTPTGPLSKLCLSPGQSRTPPRHGPFSEISRRPGPVGRDWPRCCARERLGGRGARIFHELELAGTVLGSIKRAPIAATMTRRPDGRGLRRRRARCAQSSRGPRGLQRSTLCHGRLHGGHLAFRLRVDARVRATACFYATDIHKGSLGLGGDDSLARAGEIEGELMMVWGRQDPHRPPGRPRKNPSPTSGDQPTGARWHEFNAAHAFLRDEGPRYNPALALIAYRMAIDLFARA